MSPQLAPIVEKGRRSLSAAQSLIDRGDFDFAASRAYYAMFYLAQAALLSKGMAFSKHSAVIAVFGQHLVKPGQLPIEMHEYLRTAFDERNVGDYGFGRAYPRERAEDLLTKARKFVACVEAFLEREVGDSSASG